METIWPNIAQRKPHSLRNSETPIIALDQHVLMKIA
jgi:hypothetical protein